jgi:hypothetical protein
MRTIAAMMTPVYMKIDFLVSGLLSSTAKAVVSLSSGFVGSPHTGQTVILFSISLPHFLQNILISLGIGNFSLIIDSFFAI